MIAALASTLLTLSAFRLPVMKNRLVESVTTGNLAGREQLYPALWTMFLERPVLGWGPITNTHEVALRIGERERPKRAAHNLVLELLTSGGLMATLIGVWLAVQSAWRARAGAHGVLPMALFCALFVANMSGDWIASKLLWLVLAYAFASGKWHVAGLRERTAIRPRQWVVSLPSTIGGR